MSTAAKAAVQGPSKLSKILQHLNAKPKLNLTGVKSLKLSYAFRNDHFGAKCVLYGPYIECMKWRFISDDL